MNATPLPPNALEYTGDLLARVCRLATANTLVNRALAIGSLQTVVAASNLAYLDLGNCGQWYATPVQAVAGLVDTLADDLSDGEDIYLALQQVAVSLKIEGDLCTADNPYTL